MRDSVWYKCLTGNSVRTHVCVGFPLLHIIWHVIIYWLYTCVCIKHDVCLAPISDSSMSSGTYTDSYYNKSQHCFCNIHILYTSNTYYHSYCIYIIILELGYLSIYMSSYILNNLPKACSDRSQWHKKLGLAHEYWSRTIRTLNFKGKSTQRIKFGQYSLGVTETELVHIKAWIDLTRNIRSAKFHNIIIRE